MSKKLVALAAGPVAVLGVFGAAFLFSSDEGRPRPSRTAPAEARVGDAPVVARLAPPIVKAPVASESPRPGATLPAAQAVKAELVAPAVVVAPVAAADPLAVRKAREGLRSRDPGVRLESLRAVRDLRSPEAEADVVLLLETERFVPARRVAAQVLALGDVKGHEKVLRDLKHDPDIIVQLNACFGLARGGDELEQGLLIAFCEASREAPKLLPLVATALEDPALRGPAVIARFQIVADDPKVDPETRERARAVLRAKRS